MITPALTGLAALLVFLLLIPRFRMWIWLRFYRRIQQDFFANRVIYIPERAAPVQPPRKLYNFIEADQFIAILTDPEGPLQHKRTVLHIISEAQSIIRRQQQCQLRLALQAMQGHVSTPHSRSLVRAALQNLERAVLID